MKIDVTKSMFRDMFVDYDRGDEFSYEGLGLLFDYLTDVEESCGVEIELDVIAICCDWAEYETALDAAKDLIGDAFVPDEDDDAEETELNAIDALQDRTTVLITNSGRVIVQSF